MSSQTHVMVGRIIAHAMLVLIVGLVGGASAMFVTFVAVIVLARTALR